eukprot:4767174-Alexandrium_andersonii.AAC.1
MCIRDRSTSAWSSRAASSAARPLVCKLPTFMEATQRPRGTRVLRRRPALAATRLLAGPGTQPGSSLLIARLLGPSGDGGTPSRLRNFSKPALTALQGK